MSTLNKRITELEKTRSPGIPLVFAKEGETNEQALARHCRENGVDLASLHNALVLSPEDAGLL